MTDETQDVEKKSLRLISGRKSRWPEVVREVVAFANARGGKLLIGIEDGESEPPAGQTVPSDLPERVRRRVGELTVNVDCVVRLQRSRTTGGEYLEIEVFRSHSPASTTDGRFFLRISDASQPLTGENVQRLLNERTALPWETLTPIDVPREEVDSQKLAEFAAAIRDSDRVKPSVREKSAQSCWTIIHWPKGRSLPTSAFFASGEGRTGFDWELLRLFSSSSTMWTSGRSTKSPGTTTPCLPSNW